MREVRDTDALKAVESIFDGAPFIHHLGIEPTRIDFGEVHALLRPRPEHLQHDGVVHAGVITTLADHTAGAAGGTVVDPKTTIVLSTNINVSLLRPGSGPELRCEAKVLRAGSRIIVADSRVYGTHEGKRKLVAQATVNLAAVPRETVTR